MLTFLLIFFLAHSGQSKHRRVFFGVREHDFKYPYGSAVSIRQKPKWDLLKCTGVIIGPRKVLTAAHCFRSDQRPSMYRVGYGSTKMAEQRTVNVESLRLCGTLDAAMLTLASALTETDQMVFFKPALWNTDEMMTIATRKTIMCGYGYYEGPNQHVAFETNSDVLRCLQYHFTANYERLVEMNRYNSLWPKIAPAVEGYKRDKRYMGSVSRDPTVPNVLDPNFSTGCSGDSGAPVFYEAGNNKYQLLGIVHAVPEPCGNASNLKYDISVFTKAVLNECP